MLKLRVLKTYANKMKKPSSALRKEIDAQLRQAIALRFSKPHEAERLSRQALKQAETIGDARRTAQAHLSLARLAFDKSEFEQVIEHCNTVTRRSSKSLDLLGDAQVLSGLVQWQKGNHPSALECYLSAINLWKKSKLNTSDLQVRLCSVFVNIGHLYTETSHYEKALDNYFRAMSYMTDQTDAHVRSTVLRSIGSVYEYLQDFDRAIDFDKQSLEIVLETKNRIGESVTRYNLGNALWLKGCLKESLTELERASDVAKAIGDKRIEVGAEVIQAAVLADLGEKEKFIERTQNLLERVDAIGIADMRTKSREILAKSFMTLNQPEKALPLFEETLSLATQFNLSIVVAEVQQELSKYYERQREFEKALSCFKQAVEILEKQRRAEAEQKLLLYEVERRVKTLEAEKQKLSSEVEKLRYELKKKKELTEKEQEHILKEIHISNPQLAKRLHQLAPKITPSELKTAELLYAKLTTKEIAQVLRVSPRTVETHRENLRKKLGLNKSQSLVAVLQTM